jgi:hypothetical protein
MDCRHGTHVARLGTFRAEGDETAILKRKLGIELLADLRGVPVELRASKLKDACPWIAYPEDRDPDMVFLYAGPFQSIESAERLCDALHIDSRGCMPMSPRDR